MNAYTGGFQEIGAFAATRFVSAAEAEKLAVEALSGKAGWIRTGGALIAGGRCLEVSADLAGLGWTGAPSTSPSAARLLPNRVRGKQRQAAARY